MAAETETVPESMPESLPESLPESVDVAGAVAMLDDAGQADEAEDQPEAVPDADPASPEASQDSEGLPSEAAEGSEGGAPEFWSAEDKAAWQDVPEALRPLIAKYEQQRIAFVNEKTREAAQVREEAMRVAQGAVGVVEQAAAWWQQNGPAFQQAFADRWSQVD